MKFISKIWGDCMNKIFQEENNQYQIDFSNALWASDQAHNALNDLGLKDVDWIVETNDGIIFVEYKNANIPNAVNPNAFETKIQTDKHYLDIAHKFYDCLSFVLLHEKKITNMKYLYIMERTIDDSTLRRMLKTKIAAKLPFSLQSNFGVKLIDEFDVLSIAEWNEKFSEFPLQIVATI